MAELKNTFCWSYSQAKDFAVCKRRHYLNRYGFWKGWDAMASADARAIYRLKQMRNKWALIGEAVDKAILDVLSRMVVGAAISEAQALERAHKELRNAWKQHQSGKWRDDPKHHVCIRELYYNEITAAPGIDRDLWVDRIKGRTETCVKNFFAHVLPRVRGLAAAQVLPIARAQQGDPEHFHLGRVKIYAIPDYAYRKDDRIVIHDWKTGMRRDEHERQLCIYGLWAQTKHAVTPAAIQLLVEYLESGELQPVAFDVGKAGAVCDFIMESVNAMRKFLLDGDLEKNEPLPLEEFPKTDDLNRCRNCNFREACNRKFVGLVEDE
jgi:CRISPR/Cas system-associated exonuclease Cas4 (RecB family)